MTRADRGSMDTVSFIARCLSQVQLRLLATCEGLAQQQVLWRPGPHANNIGFILWHVARGEDSRVSGLKETRSHLWESQGWHLRFDQPVDAPDPGDRMGLRALSLPALSVLLGYLEAAHEQTLGFLSTVTGDGLDIVPDSSQPYRTVAASLRHLITHKNNHHGQVDYIRGMQDNTWDLPPGTGEVLPPTASIP